MGARALTGGCSVRRTACGPGWSDRGGCETGATSRSREVRGDAPCALDVPVVDTLDLVRGGLEVHDLWR